MAIFGAVGRKMTGKTYTMEEIRSVAQEMSKDPDSSTRAKEGVEWFIKPKTYPLLPEPDRGSVAVALGRQRMEERLEHAAGFAKTIAQVAKQREEQKREELARFKSPPPKSPMLVTEVSLRLPTPKAAPTAPTGVQWKKDDVCVALWEADGLYYPARILQVFAGDETVEVDYVDYEGCRAIVPLRHVLRKDQVDASKAEPQAQGGEKTAPTLCYTREEILAFKSPQPSVSPPIIVAEEDPKFHYYNRDEVMGLKPPLELSLPPVDVKRSPPAPPPTPEATGARWKKGDICMALWEADGGFYPARVLQVFAADETAEVVYIGYRDSNAIVELRHLLTEEQVDVTN